MVTAAATTDVMKEVPAAETAVGDASAVPAVRVEYRPSLADRVAYGAAYAVGSLLVVIMLILAIVVWLVASGQSSGAYCL